MKVFIPLIKGNEDIHNSWNPFCYTLIDYISSRYPDVKFYNNIEIFDTPEVFTFDVVHIMWASVFFYIGDSITYQNRLREIKQKGCKIVSTCHNLTPHYIRGDDKINFYNVTYEESDTIIHLGKYSKEIFEQRYNDIRQVLIPHHIYDTEYTKTDKQNDSFKKYISCIGAFRDKEEIDLLKHAGKILFFSRYFILAPSLMISIQWSRRNKIIVLKQLLKLAWYKYRYHIISLNNKWIDHDELVKYMNLSCITFIQRKVNLNSGNLTLGFLFKNVVIGPNIGNIGSILKETDNPYFDPSNTHSLKKAFYKAIQLQKKGKGLENYNYAIANWSTRICGDKHYNVYIECE